MNLEPGYYKVTSRSGRSSKSFHYLRVFIKNKNKYVQIDDGVPQEANDEMSILLESYSLVKRITHHNPIDVSNAVMTISWNDEDSDPFMMRMRNIQTFKKALDLFPRIGKALGVVKMKKK